MGDRAHAKKAQEEERQQRALAKIAELGACCQPPPSSLLTLPCLRERIGCVSPAHRHLCTAHKAQAAPCCFPCAVQFILNYHVRSFVDSLVDGFVRFDKTSVFLLQSL